MCDKKYHYTPKSLKKKFKNMTRCFECGHLDEFQALSRCGELDEHGLDKHVSVCCGCGSTNISRKPTIELARTWIPAKVWRENRAPTGDESVQNEEIPPV